MPPDSMVRLLIEHASSERDNSVMIPRGALDIRWFALVKAYAATFHGSINPSALTEAVTQAWDSKKPIIVTHSMRSGLDAVLTAARFPAGSEILLSAVTIPDVVRIITAHELVPVPLDVLPSTLSPDLEQMRARVTQRTRAVLIAHLFGSRIDLTPFARLTRQLRLNLWEDVAQGFATDGFRGSTAADVSFFSFGMIKHQTALGGGIVQFNDAELARACQDVQSPWPRQRARDFRRKVVRCSLLAALTNRHLARWAFSAAKLTGMDIEKRLNDATRGYPGPGLFEHLRQQPSCAMLKLLAERLFQPDGTRIAAKSALATELRRLLPGEVLLGQEAQFPSHWVFPMISRNRQGLCQRLRMRGFDATIAASRLIAAPAPQSRPDCQAPGATSWLAQSLYLPLHPKMNSGDLQTIAKAVTEFERQQAG